MLSVLKNFFRVLLAVFKEPMAEITEQVICVTLKYVLFKI